MQHEIVAPGPLLRPDGRLREAGWARRPLLDANLEQAAPGLLRRLRIKRWDYYGVWTEDHFFSATLSHLGYVGLVFSYAIDLAKGELRSHAVLRPFGRGVSLPRSSDAGVASYVAGDLRYVFTTAGDLRRLDVLVPDFDGGRGLRFDVELAPGAAHESIVMATQMGADRFYYNRKLSGAPARGTIAWGDRRFELGPGALGQLDWGRGVWPWASHWLWASGNGRLDDGRIVGLNLGAGFGDLSRATENCVFVDGRLHKLGTVRFELDPRDYRKPWRFRDEDGRLDVALAPSFERVDATDLWLLRSEVHQLFGGFSGTVSLDDGETLSLRALPGFAEEHRARW